MPLSRRRHRGQAMLEAALGIIAFIAVVVAGIYFAEVGYLSLEATEAANEPLWDATAGRMHNFTTHTWMQRSAVAGAQASAQGRQKQVTQVFARSTPARVACRGTGAGITFTVPFASVLLQDQGGMACRASLDVDSPLFPHAFLEGNDGFFTAPMAAIARPLHVQETKSGKGFAMMVDDWAFSHPTEATQHLAYAGGNPALYSSVDVLYQANGAGAGYDYLRLTDFALGTVPANYTKVVDLQLSFRGEESNFIETLQVSMGQPEWPATPYYQEPQASYGMRAGCFLGMGCSAQP